MADVREWLSGFHFSRGTRHLARDFSDAVLLAELLAQLVPAWVDLHNYPSANRTQHKLVNWETLNRKVLARIKCELSRKQQEDLANAAPGVIDLLLAQVRKQDELPMRDEQQAWQQNDRVQVARFVRSLASGDCLVQLLKVDGIRKSSISPRSRGVKVYVSTPHFIECCGSQLHNIQNMKFDATEGKWKWHRSENSSSSSSSSTDKTSGVSWKRSLLIDIAPGVSSIPAGLRTEPIRKSLHPTVMTKKTSHNSHFFTEVLSRVKCNSISMEEPVAIVGRTRDEEADGTLCADFAQTVYDTIGFDSPVAPTVFPKVQADVLLDIPEKKPLASPTRARKSNAESVEAT